MTWSAAGKKDPKDPDLGPPVKCVGLNLAAGSLVESFRALATYPGSRGSRSALEEEGALPTKPKQVE